MVKKQPDQEQSEMWKANPERYAKCSEPFSTYEAANVAMEAFLADVSAAREKHSISDVEVVVKDSYGKGDDCGTFLGSAHFGNVLERETMLAFALGRVQKGREQMIAKLLAGAGSRDA